MELFEIVGSFQQHEDSHNKGNTVYLYIDEMRGHISDGESSPLYRYVNLSLRVRMGTVSPLLSSLLF